MQRSRRSPAGAAFKSLLKGLILLPVVLFGACVAGAIVEQATTGCFAMPGTSDGCRDPYLVLNWTRGPVTITQTIGTETHTLTTIDAGTSHVIPQYRPGDDRCQDGFGLVALNAAGGELARLDRWCRFETWIVLEPGTTVPPA